MSVIKTNLFVALLFLSSIFSPMAVAEPSNSYYQDFVNGISKTVYAFAWPTAKYHSMEFAGISRLTNGAEVNFRLYGISSFDRDWLWTDVKVRIEQGSITDLSWGNNNALLMKPGATVKAFKTMLANLNRQVKPNTLVQQPDGYGFMVTNNCNHPVKIAIKYTNTNNQAVAIAWWTFSAKSSDWLQYSGQKISTNKAVWYFYAKTFDKSGYIWAGNYSVNVDGDNLPMRRIEDDTEENEITLVCN